jgi:hypothetical protein
MLNLEKLILSFRARRRTSLIDGTYLTNEILNYMPHLQTFEFDIASENRTMNVFPEPTSEDIRRTFIERGHHVDCYIDYNVDESSRSHIYSLPFTLERIHFITSKFPGGMFMNVRVLRVCDMQRSFEKIFFAKIARSFPLLRRLIVFDLIERLEKPWYQLKKSQETSSIIEFSHLAELILQDVHIDYVEQFLSSANTSLPSLTALTVQYEHLKVVTKNFTRDATRINCAKLKYIFFGKVIHLAQPRNFYLYFPCL